MLHEKLYLNNPREDPETRSSFTHLSPTGTCQRQWRLGKEGVAVLEPEAIARQKTEASLRVPQESNDLYQFVD